MSLTDYSRHLTGECRSYGGHCHCTLQMADGTSRPCMVCQPDGDRLDPVNVVQKMIGDGVQPSAQVILDFVSDLVLHEDKMTARQAMGDALVLLNIWEGTRGY